MQQTKGIGIYKKGKNSNLGNSAASSQISEFQNKSRNEQVNQPSRYEKGKQEKNINIDQGSWMGSQTPNNQPHMRIENQKKQKLQNTQNITPKKPIQPQILFNSLLGKSPTQNNSQQKDKMPMKLIQDILKGISKDNNQSPNTNPFYSKRSEQTLTQLLTNSNKLSAYIQQLQSQMAEVSEQVSQNYEILIILLKNLAKSDLEVKVTNERGLQLNFNANLLAKQEHEIQSLQKKIKQKDDQLKEIVEDYEAVIRNFNDVIQKLLAERQLANNKNINRNQNNTPSQNNNDILQKIFK